MVAPPINFPLFKHSLFFYNFSEENFDSTFANIPDDIARNGRKSVCKAASAVNGCRFRDFGQFVISTKSSHSPKYKIMRLFHFMINLIYLFYIINIQQAVLPKKRKKNEREKVILLNKSFI